MLYIQAYMYAELSNVMMGRLFYGTVAYFILGVKLLINEFNG